MSDTNLDPSISALSTRATEVAASASARELLNLSRIAPSLEQSENAGLEVAINSRAAGLAPSATATELKSIGKAIGNVLEPDTFIAGAFIPSQLDQGGKFLGTSGTSKNWSGVTVSGLSEVNISDIANDETLVYNHVSSQFENSSQVFNIPQYAQTADLPASATSGATAFDASTAELKYWDGSEWKVAAVVATGGGASIKSVQFLQPYAGGGRWIVVADSDDFTLTGAFTIETWLKPAGTVQAASKTYTTIASKWTPADPEYWFGFVASGGQQNIRFSWADQTSQGDSNNPILNYPTNDFVDGSWVHVAVVRTTDGTITMYVNGVSVDSVSRSFTPAPGSTSEPLYIGSYNAGEGNADWEGLISDFRIVNGDAVYTANFTPPTQPLQKIANTVLLTARGVTESGDAIADESDSNHAIETNYAVEIFDEMPYTS